MLVDGNETKCVTAEPGQIECLMKAAMSLDGGISGEADFGGGNAGAPYAHAERGITRYQDGKIVGK